MVATSTSAAITEARIVTVRLIQIRIGSSTANPDRSPRTPRCCAVRARA
jgi:hypothetical protein